MYQSFKMARKEFVKELKKGIREYKDIAHSSLEEKVALDTKKLSQDWENVGKDFPIR